MEFKLTRVLPLFLLLPAGFMPSAVHASNNKQVQKQIEFPINQTQEQDTSILWKLDFLKDLQDDDNDAVEPTTVDPKKLLVTILHDQYSFSESKSEGYVKTLIQLLSYLDLKTDEIVSSDSLIINLSTFSTQELYELFDILNVLHAPDTLLKRVDQFIIDRAVIEIEKNGSFLQEAIENSDWMQKDMLSSQTFFEAPKTFEDELSIPVDTKSYDSHVVFSPKKDAFAVREGNKVTLRTSVGKEITTFISEEKKAECEDIVFSPDGRFFITSFFTDDCMKVENRIVRFFIWDMQKGEKKEVSVYIPYDGTLKPPTYYRGEIVFPSNNTFVMNISSLTGNMILGYDLETGKLVNAHDLPGNYSYDGKVTKDHKSLILTGTGFTLSLLDIETGKITTPTIQPGKTKQGEYTESYYSPDGTYVLKIGKTGHSTVWNVETGEQVMLSKNPLKGTPYFDRSGKFLFLAYADDFDTQVYDLEKKTCVFELKKSKDRQTPRGFTFDGRFFITRGGVYGSKEGFVWDTKTIDPQTGMWMLERKIENIESSTVDIGFEHIAFCPTIKDSKNKMIIIPFKKVQLTSTAQRIIFKLLSTTKQTLTVNASSSLGQLILSLPEDVVEYFEKKGSLVLTYVLHCKNSGI